MARIVNLSNFQQFAAINLTSDPGYDRSDRHIPNTAQITLTWLLEDGKLVHNVLHGGYTGGYSGTIAKANAILTQLTTGAQWDSLKVFLSTTTTLGNVVLRDLNVENTATIQSDAIGATGSSPGTALPNEVAAVVTLRTQFVGPQFRGRMYVPGWATNALGTGNVIAAGAVTGLINWSSIIAGVLASQGFQFGIGHYSRLEYTSASGGHHDARPPGLEPITSVTVRDNHWDTQRRRGLS